MSTIYICGYPLFCLIHRKVDLHRKEKTNVHYILWIWISSDLLCALWIWISSDLLCALWIWISTDLLCFFGYPKKRKMDIHNVDIHNVDILLFLDDPHDDGVPTISRLL